MSCLKRRENMAKFIKIVYAMILFVSIMLTLTYGDPSCTCDYDCPFIECPTHHMKCISNRCYCEHPHKEVIKLL
ncbi:unnamed protein product [Lathyrus oleraceus]